MYLIALYWSLQTLTSVGYGDIGGDQTTYEVYAACFAIYVGTIAFGWIIGNVTAIVMEEDRVTFTVQQKISELSSYMQQRQLSRPLRKRIAQFYDTKWKASTVFDEAAVLLELPSCVSATAHSFARARGSSSYISRAHYCELPASVLPLPGTCATSSSRSRTFR